MWILWSRGCQWFWAEALLEDAKENQLLPDLVTGRSEFRNMGTRKRGK
jgi:hypothetical protein